MNLSLVSVWYECEFGSEMDLSLGGSGGGEVEGLRVVSVWYCRFLCGFDESVESGIPSASITRSRRGFLRNAEGVPGWSARDGVGSGLSDFTEVFLSGPEGVEEVFHGNFLPMAEVHYW